MYGGLANCTATGTTLSAASCNTARAAPVNVKANPNTKICLEQTWARPDMVEAHKITTPDLTTADGRPMVDSSAAGGNATLYYANLAGMTTDMHSAFYSLKASNPGFTDVIPVGDSFQRAVDQGLAIGSGFYNAGGTYVEPASGMNLWWLDRTHASKYGSYLSALTTFGSVTGLDPRMLGANEQAGIDLGIGSLNIWALEQVAAVQLGFSPNAVPVPEPANALLLAAGLAGMAGAARRRRQA